ncbi:MAG: YIP1 family protein [Bacillus sp. (in: firmicutes)]
MNDKQKPSLLKMFWRPKGQFVKITSNPIMATPLIIVTVIYIMASMVKALFIRAEDLMFPGMTAQEADMVAATAKAFTAMLGFISPVFTILLTTIIYFIILKIARKDTTFKQLFSMNTYIFVVQAVGLLINSLLMMVIDCSSGSAITSLALFNRDWSMLHALELFTIWKFVLTAIGFHLVGQLSKSTSIILVIVLFILQNGTTLLGIGALSLWS